MAENTARILIEERGFRARQIVVDRTVAAVRVEDAPLLVHLDHVRRAIEAHLDTAQNR